MAIFVDIFMAACLLLALVLGVRQGFLQSLARVAIIIVALLGAAWLAEHLADPAAKWLEPMLTEKIQQQMDGQAAAADDPSLAAAGLLETFGFSGEALDKLVESATEKAQEVGQTLLSAVVSTVLRSVAYAVVYLVSFLLLLLLLRLLLAPLHLFTKLPVVHGINAVMGGALGLVKGALLLFFAVWMLRRLQIWITPELISQTYILRFFCGAQPHGADHIPLMTRLPAPQSGNTHITPTDNGGIPCSLHFVPDARKTWPSCSSPV